MRAPVYLICAILLAAVKTEENVPPYFGKQLERQQSAPSTDQLALVSSLAEQDAYGYLLPKLMPKYRVSREWNPRYVDPRLLNSLNEIDSNSIVDQVRRHYI